MDQNNAPRPDNEPFQPYEPSGQPAPGGAQVYPQYTPPPPPGQSFTPPPPVVPPAAPPKSSRRTWLIVLIVVLLLCCCCIVLALVYAYNNGDAWMIEMCRQDPTLPFCQ